MELILDDRERELIPLLQTATVKRLTLADVLLLDADGNVVLALERKTVADLEASVRDGRLQDQRARLVEAYGRRFAFVVEGKVDHGDPRLAGVMTGLVVRHRLPVFRTSSVKDTASLVEHLAKGAAQGKLEAYDACNPASVADAPKKKVLGRDAAEAMLSCVSGVSKAAARAVLEKYGDIKTVALALDAEGPSAVSGITVNGRKLGKVADKLAAAMCAA